MIIQFPQVTFLKDGDEVVGAQLNCINDKLSIMSDGKVVMKTENEIAIANFKEDQLVDLMLSFLVINYPELLNIEMVEYD